MKTKNLRAGLAILAGGLSFIGAAGAADVVVNGSFESPGIAGPPIDGGWTPFTTYNYSAGYTQTAPAGAQLVYFTANSITSATQTDSLTLTPDLSGAQIDASQGKYTFSAWFSTYYGNNDYSTITLQFLDGSQSPVGSSVVVGGAAFVAALPGGTGLRAWGQDSETGLIPPTARYAQISVVGTALSGSADAYTDLVSLNVTNEFVPVQLTSAVPANNATNLSAGATISVSLLDGTSALDTSSIVFTYDGSPATPVVSKPGSTTTVQFDPPGLIPSLSTHTYKIAYNNAGGAVANTTNQFSFTVGSWVNINIGSPIYEETFDGIAEGALPAGWSVANMTDLDIVPGYDLNNFHSDAYLDWVVISRSTLSNLISVTPGGGDFIAVTNVVANQVINGSLVTNLIDTNFIFAVSDRSDNQKQIQYLFTSDYNLSSQTNVYLAFKSIWVQNQNSLAAVEYSIDGGTTWLPAQYMLDGPDVVFDGGGNIDASNTFATIRADVPNLALATLVNGYYGQFIGVDSNLWSGLAPYLSPRVNDNQFTSKRIELIRLQQADNQSAVRVRFSSAGEYAWYWGIDNFGLYSIAIAPPSFTGSPTPAVSTVAVGNPLTLTVPAAVGAGPFNYQWRRNGVNLPGKTALALVIPAVKASDAGSYDVVASNLGGSATSAPPAAVVTTLNPFILVTGQWDFKSNLVATCGQDLQYFDAAVSNVTTFGTTTDFGISDIGGQPTTVMHFTPPGGAWGGYKMFHGANPNGGGAYVNQYTLVFDVYYPSSASASWGSFLQTATGNNNDGDFFVRPDGSGGGIGISSTYHGSVSLDAWHRIAFAFDLSGPGTFPVLTKFIDGVKVGQQTTGLSAKDGRFALEPFALLFADNDGDTRESYVSSIQFSDGRRSDEFIAALGGPTVTKIPGCITAAVEGGNVVIRWTGSVPLEGSDNLTGPWSTVSTTSPYTVNTSKKFYRPKIP